MGQQAHQRAVVQPGRAQLEAHQGHAHAGSCGVAHQANVVELESLRWAPPSPGR